MDDEEDEVQGEQVERPRGPLTASDEIRASVRFLYDLQRLRIQAGGRQLQQDAGKKVDLKPGDLGYMDSLAGKLKRFELDAEKHVELLCSAHPMNAWLRAIRGVGPRMAGVILSEIDISRASTVSSLWKFAGLAVVVGDEEGDPWHADRRKKGVKLGYNSFLKIKLVKVLADSFIKSNSPYKRYYDERKHRQESAGWGKSKGHRDADARRVMIKRFLADLYVEWRTLEGLPVRAPYAEEYLNRVHHEKEPAKE